MIAPHDHIAQFVHGRSDVKRGVFPVHRILTHAHRFVAVPHTGDVQRIAQSGCEVKETVFVGIGGLEGRQIDHMDALHRFFRIQIDDTSAYDFLAQLRIRIFTK